MKDYFLNINIINKFLNKELKDTIILPVLTSDIACNSIDTYSNFAYTTSEDATDAKNKDLAKSKLKHSIIKNMLYNNEIKTRQDAEYYFKTISDTEYKLDSGLSQRPDKVAYYLDFVNEYNLLTDVLDKEEVEQSIKNAVYALKADISKHKSNNDLLKLAIDTYLGPIIFLNYNLIDIVVVCGIIILSMLLYVLKYFINIYIVGILLLLFILCIVFLTIIFI